MGKLWNAMDTDELILNYNCIQWGLAEGVHCMVRRFEEGDFVIPQIVPSKIFENELKPGMIEASDAIKVILQRRGIDKIPVIEFQMMAHETLMWRSLGWRVYKETAQAGMDVRRSND